MDLSDGQLSREKHTFRPGGLKSFSVTPQLPVEWNEMALRNLIAFGGENIDIEVSRENGKIKTMILIDGKLLRTYKTSPGTTLMVKIQ